jgi:hypothetical protein
MKTPYVFSMKLKKENINKYNTIRAWCNSYINSTWAYTNINGSYYKVDPFYVLYIAFSSEEDAMQFKLSNDVEVKKAHMWPHNSFIIYEYISE